MGLKNGILELGKFSLKMGKGWYHYLNGVGEEVWCTLLFGLSFSYVLYSYSYLKKLFALPLC